MCLLSIWKNEPMEIADCSCHERKHQTEAIQSTEQLLIQQRFDHEKEHVFSTWYSGMYVQFDLLPKESRMVVTMVLPLRLTGLQRQYRQVNTLNRECSFGSHMMDPTIGCYSYRVSVWLDCPLTRKRLFHFLELFAEQARKGMERLQRKSPD